MHVLPLVVCHYVRNCSRAGAWTQCECPWLCGNDPFDVGSLQQPAACGAPAEGTGRRCLLGGHRRDEGSALGRAQGGHCRAACECVCVCVCVCMCVLGMHVFVYMCEYIVCVCVYCAWHSVSDVMLDARLRVCVVGSITRHRQHTFGCLAQCVHACMYVRTRSQNVLTRQFTSTFTPNKP